MSACSIEHCSAKLLARGMCHAHYKKWAKYGDATAGKKRAPNGAGCKRSDGYVIFTVSGEPKMEHIAVAERALGKPLPPGAKVHHVDENKSNNDPSNLVVCPSEAYHQLLHQRMRAVAACGNPSWRICTYCQKYDMPGNMFIHPRRTQAYHRACRNERDRNIIKKAKP